MGKLIQIGNQKNKSSSTALIKIFPKLILSFFWLTAQFEGNAHPNYGTNNESAHAWDYATVEDEHVIMIFIRVLY